jgi:periplasmic protein TonB
VTDTLILDELARQREADPPVRDRLTTTFFLVAMLHAIVILGVSFGPGGRGTSEARSLEVLLVHDPVPDSSENANADYLAQVTQHGAGNQKDARGAQSPRAAPVAAGAPANVPEPEDLGLTAGSEQEGELDLVATRSAGSTSRFSAPHPSAGSAAGAPFVMAPKAVTSGADKGEELRLRGKASRELLVTANTRESSVAVYLDGWRRRIEAVGTLNYPMDAAKKRRASGNPELEVQILDDGTLGEASIRRSSGVAELDQAALGILKLASPFAPFPARLANKHDALRLIYEWQFLDGSLEDTTVRMPENTR